MIIIIVGTPSLMKPTTVESVINAVASSVHLSCDAEVNLEANPTSVEIKKLRSVIA
jgi:oxygen-independent coproporphyrinogen-3 oxidase